MPPFVSKAKPVKNPPLKWHGGKHDLAEWIISLMPPRPSWLHFVEPYFGGGSVMLAMNPEGVSEVANDIDGELTNFWRVLQSPSLFSRFRQMAEATPFSRPVWTEAGDVLAEDPRDQQPEKRAWAFFVRCRQSYAGRMKEFTAITRRRVRRGMNEQVSAWLSCVDGLPEVHARMRRVLVLNEPALDVIRKQDGEQTLFYLDPPYLHETRVTTGEYGENEMTSEDHDRLLTTLVSVKGRFLLSGYPSELYGEYERRFGWRCHERVIDNHASSAKVKPRKTECVWVNY